MIESQDFFKAPILNSPYQYPKRHWQLDNKGQPTNIIENFRRIADFVTPIPAPKNKGKQEQDELTFNEAKNLSSADGLRYEKTAQTINALRLRVDKWRAEPDINKWKVTPETARLLQHWRSFQFTDLRPFFCQIEAAEIAIWLTEVAPQNSVDQRNFLDYLEAANDQANPGLPRLALKLATGAGKTTVMAMLIAWQTVNAIRRPNSSKFTKGFLAQITFYFAA